MVTAAELDGAVLTFRAKSFAFDRGVTVRGSAWGVFSRTETESESKFRPRLVRLLLAVPLDLIHLDAATGDAQLVGSPGTGPSEPEAREVAAEGTEFEEAGRAFVRRDAGPGRIVYLPRESAAALEDAGLAAVLAPR